MLNSRPRKARRLPCLLLLGACISATGFLGSGDALAAEIEDPAEWQVKGLGFFQNRKLKKQLDLVFQEPRRVFEASDIEDAALVLISFLRAKGYLEAKSVATLDLPDGETEEVVWDSDLDVYLERDTKATKVRFDLEKGPRFYYKELEITGIETIDLEEAESFFYSPPMLFESERARVFTHGLLDSSRANLQSHLNSLGRIKATVRAEVTSIDEETGAVNARVEVSEGPMHRFGSLRIENAEEKQFVPRLEVEAFEGEPYSRFLAQDIVRTVRNQYYEGGYPEVQVQFKRELVPQSEYEVLANLVLMIDEGPKLFVSDVGFEGSERTKDFVLRSRLVMAPGDPLDPSDVDESRLKLSRLGVFEKVTYETRPDGEDKRSILFRLRERPVWEADVLLGWGSYEQARLGVQAERLNVFGLGHRTRVQSVVSIKSRLGEWRYLMPQFLGSKTTVSTKLFGLRREEISFDRVELGFDVAASRRIEFLDLDMEGVYTFQSLEAKNVRSREDVGLEEGNAGSVALRLGRDERDSPLNPRDGYRFFGRFEYAAKFMGGDVDFQRAEVGIAWHGEVSRGLYWHAGLTHGAIGSLAEPERQVPFVKLFFPGGENSIRGYRRGEASPKDAEGNVFGARSFLLANLELEQMLGESLSAVLFFDGLGTSRSILDYPYVDTLSSVGLGVRFKTFMGPVRFEYGHNLNPRPTDPDGTFHFSLGYPF